MRSLILFSLLLLPLTACMTQRDKTVWAEFKAEISGEKAEEKKAEAAPEAATETSEEAAKEAVQAPSPN